VDNCTLGEKEAAMLDTIPPLTDRQQQILDYIRSHQDRLGYPPTIREIGKRFGIRSPNGVTCTLQALRRKGYLTSTARTSRTLTARPAPSPGMPMLGQVAAGPPTLAYARRDERIRFDEMFSGSDLFALQVSGTSLSSAAIEDGDYIILRRASAPQAGDQVVALVDGVMQVQRVQSGAPAELGEVLGVLVGVLRKCA
jgi:repressor LexA